MCQLLVDEGANWTLQSEQEQRDRTAGVKAFYSMLASTTSGRAKELVKRDLSDRNGMIAFGRVRERFGKTAGVAKLSDVFQFQWTSLRRSGGQVAEMAEADEASEHNFIGR